MFDRLLDRVFGKRYRNGWPRGVQPIFPEAAALKAADPKLWKETSTLPAGAGFPIWAEKHPTLMRELFPDRYA